MNVTYMAQIRKMQQMRHVDCYRHCSLRHQKCYKKAKLSQRWPCDARSCAR